MFFADFLPLIGLLAELRAVDVSVCVNTVAACRCVPLPALAESGARARARSRMLLTCAYMLHDGVNNKYGLIHDSQRISIGLWPQFVLCDSDGS